MPEEEVSENEESDEGEDSHADGSQDGDGDGSASDNSSNDSGSNHSGDVVFSRQTGGQAETASPPKPGKVQFGECWFECGCSNSLVRRNIGTRASNKWVCCPCANAYKTLMAKRRAKELSSGPGTKTATGKKRKSCISTADLQDIHF